LTALCTHQLKNSIILSSLNPSMAHRFKIETFIYMDFSSR